MLTSVPNISMTANKLVSTRTARLSVTVCQVIHLIQTTTHALVIPLLPWPRLNNKRLMSYFLIIVVMVSLSLPSVRHTKFTTYQVTNCVHLIIYELKKSCSGGRIYIYILPDVKVYLEIWKSNRNGIIQNTI